MSILRAIKPTPILNQPDFKAVFGRATLPLDSQGLLRPVEMIALPNTRFTLVREIDATTLQVETKDYPSSHPLYIDRRFVCSDPTCLERKKRLPKIPAILSSLENAVGLPYIWGGNWGDGIPEIATYYNPDIPPNKRAYYLLGGVDCSGLLYQATDGYTPRNSTDLCKFGERVPSLSHVKPLDIIVWPGHVLICLSETHVIESTPECGVAISTLDERKHLLSDKKFQVRRFIH